MTNAAQVDRQPVPDITELPQELQEPFALKQQVAERLAAHRARRSGGTSVPSAATGYASAIASETDTPQRAPVRSRIAATVAQRYAESPSYRAVLAEESARALHQAEAAAEVASINARAIARAQQQLLSELGDWDQPQQPVTSVPLKSALPPAQPAAVAAAILAQQKADRAILMPEPPPARVPSAEVATPAYTVRMYEDTGRPAPPPPIAYSIAITAAPDEDEAMLLDEEIAFRHDPRFWETTGPEPIPANLIEFPRQLVAARKARPRLAEGPLRDDPSADPGQLRIFEVEADHISVAPAEEAAAPEWSSILLPAHPATTFFDPLHTDVIIPTLVPQPAPLGRRLMSAVVDLSLVTVCVLAAVAVFVSTAVRITHTPLTMPLPIAIAAALASVVAFGLIYHQLFFLFSEATPGMRYARIALCTLSDENPTRSAMRRRLLAMGLSGLPLGLGYVWAMLDEDGLGWHDRISRMYQRAY